MKPVRKIVTLAFLEYRPSHLLIVQALRSRDLEKAQLAMRQHIEETSRSALSILRGTIA